MNYETWFLLMAQKALLMNDKACALVFLRSALDAVPGKTGTARPLALKIATAIDALSATQVNAAVQQ